MKKLDESEKLCELLERLNVNGKDGLDKLEWTGNCAPGYSTTRNENKDINVEIDDEDDLDPLKILVSHSGAGFHKKQHRYETEYNFTEFVSILLLIQLFF